MTLENPVLLKADLREAALVLQSMRHPILAKAVLQAIELLPGTPAPDDDHAHIRWVVDPDGTEHIFGGAAQVKGYDLLREALEPKLGAYGAARAALIVFRDKP